MDAVPKEIRQGGPRTLTIVWADGARSDFDVRGLRLACPCASCVDETTGERTLDPSRVPEDVRPARVRSVGNYALQIAWSDGHDTGIYSFSRLRALADS